MTACSMMMFDMQTYLVSAVAVDALNKTLYPKSRTNKTVSDAFASEYIELLKNILPEPTELDFVCMNICTMFIYNW